MNVLERYLVAARGHESVINKVGTNRASAYAVVALVALLFQSDALAQLATCTTVQRGVFGDSADFVPPQVHTVDAATKALYHFDEYRGSVLHDLSGNGNHGTLHGPTWTTEHP